MVGYIASSNFVQVQFPIAKSVPELEYLIAHLTSLPQIRRASINLVSESSPDQFIPNDPWNGASWNIYEPAGENWGVEKIRAPYAWAHRSNLQRVNVGVIDTRIDFRHEDLAGRSVNLNSAGAPCHHGTHVAGTLGATFNNGIGISGVAPNSRLFGYSANTLAHNDIAGHVRALELLIRTHRAQIINFSMNNGRLEGFAADRGNINAQNFIYEGAADISLFLSDLLEQRYEFLIVTSAGNNNNIEYIVDDSVEFGFRVSDRAFDFLRNTVSGNVDARYNSFFNAITDEEIRDRIIVVGSICTQFRESDFSNRNPDIFAPGERIFSTLPNNTYGDQWGGRWMSGTSMSAPHVSGVATMVWGADPNLSGADVRNIILNNVTSVITPSNNINVVNARNAVAEAIRHTDGVPTGMFSAVVVSSHTDQPMTGVNVRALNAQGRLVAETTTSAEGRFGFTLPAGRYTFEFSFPWYETLTNSVTITADTIILLADPIVLTRLDIQPPITQPPTEPPTQPPPPPNGDIPANAIRIRTEAELRAISGGTQSEGRYYVLDNDIHLTQEWIPLVDFRGTLNGQGYAVHNLFVLGTSNRDNAGFFASTSNAIIKNIIIHIGGAGITANPNTTLGSSMAGGLIARATNSIHITNVHVIGNITAIHQQLVASSSRAGGLIGDLISNGNSRIERSSFIGNISARHGSSSAYAGGLIGHSFTFFSGGNGSLAISNAFSRGQVTSSIGTDSDRNRSQSLSAGLVGVSQGRITVENTYSTSTISALSPFPLQSWTQALATFWDAEFPFLVNSFWSTTQNAICSHGGTQLTPEQMRNQASFIGWDFENVWAIAPTFNDGFPYLQGMRP